MTIDHETWLIDEGSKIVGKKSVKGYESLTSLEKAVYCFWAIDYAVRNSGTLEPMRELHKSARAELIEFSKNNNCKNLSSMLAVEDEKVFCEAYLERFEKACQDLHDLYEWKLVK
jgi:hypothetical protein